MKDSTTATSSAPRPDPEYYRNQVRRLTNLPTLPTIAARLLQATRQDNLSVSQILPIIEQDPPLAMKVLKIANSAFYGLRQKVDSLQRAVVILGMEALGQLAVSFSIVRLFEGLLSKARFQWRAYWEHSAACGHIGELLNRRLKINLPGNIYAMGLLHDVGKLALYRLDPLNYEAALHLAAKELIPSWQAEEQVLGVNHMEIGGLLAEAWELPPALVEAIKYHHDPDRAELPLVASLTQLADLVSNFRCLNFGTEFVQSIPREEAGWKIIQAEVPELGEMDFEHFVLSIDDELDEIKGEVTTLLEH